MDSIGNCKPSTEVRPSIIHGEGLFARVAIAAGTRVVQYIGEKISKAESLRRCEHGNNFVFALDDKQDLDGNVPWNLARFLNHSCAASCEAMADGGRIWIVARRDIEPGEELTFNYGYDLVDYHEHACHCGALECAGFIVAEQFFEHMEKQHAWQRQPCAGLETDVPIN